MEILKIESLGFTYALGSTPALQNVSFAVEDGAFVLICGPSGCGKSTLLRTLKPHLAPAGSRTGKIFYMSQDLYETPDVDSSGQIGFVMQDPEAQIVTDKVWHELAFGLENLGVPQGEIRRRVAEMSNFFGIHTWFRKKTVDLSGGQKQILNLAAIMLMDPKVLILDEPTSQLDPIASMDFINALYRVNQELGTTVIMTEHNLEECYGLATDILLMEKGGVVAYSPPREMAQRMAEEQSSMYCALPTASRLYNEVSAGDNCPLTIVEGRRWAKEYFGDTPMLAAPDTADTSPRPDKAALELRNVWFQYKKGADPILRNLSLDVRKGEFYCMLGGNGTGKTTSLSVLSGRLKPADGKVLVAGENMLKKKTPQLFSGTLGILPQNPQSMFVFETLREDLEEMLSRNKLSKEEISNKLENITQKLGIHQLLDRHPYDLSGGEMQRAALAKILLREPKILLLDEPTKGLDALAKQNIGQILSDLVKDGMTVLMVTHDIEFAAVYSTRCSLFFDGYIVVEAPTKEFFRSNRFYTTAVSRILRQVCDGVVTYDEGVELCRQAIPV